MKKFQYPFAKAVGLLDQVGVPVHSTKLALSLAGLDTGL